MMKSFVSLPTLASHPDICDHEHYSCMRMAFEFGMNDFQRFRKMSVVGFIFSGSVIWRLVVVVTVSPLASCYLGSFFRTMKTRSDDVAQASTQLASSQPPRQAATKIHRAQAGSHAGRQLQARSHASRQLASTQAGRRGECWRNPINFLAKSLENPDTILAISWENSEKILAEFWQNPGKILAES